MSFSFLSTKRPSLSSLFQFSCTTSGFSSKSSFLSSVTEKDYASQKITSLWTLNRVDWNQNKATVQMGLIQETQTRNFKNPFFSKLLHLIQCDYSKCYSKKGFKNFYRTLMCQCCFIYDYFTNYRYFCPLETCRKSHFLCFIRLTIDNILNRLNLNKASWTSDSKHCTLAY